MAIAVPLLALKAVSGVLLRASISTGGSPTVPFWTMVHPWASVAVAV